MAIHPSKGVPGIITSRLLSVKGMGKSPACSRCTAIIDAGPGGPPARRAMRNMVSPFFTSALRAAGRTMVPLMVCLGSGALGTISPSPPAWAAVGAGAEGQHLRRSYSIASMSDHGESLRFLIRVIPGGVASDFFLHLPLGSTVEMTGPHGFFVLAPQHPGDVVFAATGTGLAPV